MQSRTRCDVCTRRGRHYKRCKAQRVMGFDNAGGAERPGIQYIHEDNHKHGSGTMGYMTQLQGNNLSDAGVCGTEKIVMGRCECARTEGKGLWTTHNTHDVLTPAGGSKILTVIGQMLSEPALIISLSVLHMGQVIMHHDRQGTSPESKNTSRRGKGLSEGLT